LTAISVVTETTKTDEAVRWMAYPSWAQFTWLYLFSMIAGVRGLLLVLLGQGGGVAWLGGAIALLVCVAMLRRWAQYVLTSRRIIVRNGFTGREIDALALDDISGIGVKQGPIARFFNIGTIVIQSARNDRVIWLRGVTEPESIKTRIEALRSNGNARLTKNGSL
jgi:membrane protein YdbS with pleckstrin-like domain